MKFSLLSAVLFGLAAAAPANHDRKALLPMAHAPPPTGTAHAPPILATGTKAVIKATGTGTAVSRLVPQATGTGTGSLVMARPSTTGYKVPKPTGPLPTPVTTVTHKFWWLQEE